MGGFKNVLGILAFTLAASGGAMADTLSVDFNTASTDLTNNFKLAGSSGSYAWSGTAGVNGGGGVTPSVTGTQNATLLYGPPATATSFNLQNTDISVSTYFQWTAPVGTASANADRVAVGLVSSNANDLSSTAGLQARLLKAANSNTFALQIRNSSIATTLSSQPVTGHWYDLTLNVHRNPDVTNQFQMSVSLQDFGTDGVTTPITIGSGSGTYTDSTDNYWTLTALYAGLLAQYDNGGATAVDNFVIVAPEPSSMLLCAGLPLWALVRRKTRRRGLNVSTSM